MILQLSEEPGGFTDSNPHNTHPTYHYMPLPQPTGLSRPPFSSEGGRFGNSNRRGNFRGPQHQQGPRRNERIRAPEVRVIGPDGQQIGVMTSHAALARAREMGYDLIEIAAGARPPVCRIMDYGKYQYEESKRQKKQKAATSRMKEVKLRPRCDVHDLMIKIRRAENFLFHGHKIKLTLSFRFRELEHPEVGHELMKQAIEKLAHIATPDHPARLMGRSMSTTLTPLPVNRRKLLYNTSADPIEDDEDEEDDDAADENDAGKDND
ncbi:MAG: translation initiation factor IF-3 [Puniceicoccales bacterium]|jgi:translation initiation factor IF-3|nr:translation initiation factor IF-3 [Puniceicoccales bacterium]